MNETIEERKTFKIPVENLPFLNMKLEEVNKKARKLSVSEIKLNVINKTEEMLWHPIKNKAIMTAFIEFEMIGETPKIDGWSLIAIIETLKETKANIVKEIPGKACPVQFRQAEMVVCDHCHVNRKRTSIFVIQHDDRKFKAVGRNCLSDFLGGVNPENLCRQAEMLFNFLDDLAEAGLDGCFEKHGIKATPILSFLARTSAIIRNCGWVPRSKADFGVCATADYAWNASFSREEDKETTIEEFDVEIATKTLKWARGLEVSDNNYLYNVKTVCQNEYVTNQTSGFVASAIVAWKKAMGDEMERKNKTKTISNWLGEIGQRLLLNLTIIDAKSYVSSAGFDKTVIRFQDETGNILVWFASGCPLWAEIGSKISVKATVKKHDSFNEQKQTLVSRVSVV